MQYPNYTKTYKTLSNLLLDTPELCNFVGKLDVLQQISAHIYSHLEPSLASQCRVANLRDGTLILSTTSPAWNHKLRYSALDILSSLRANPQWSGLKSIEVRVDYLPENESMSSTNLKSRLGISSHNAQLLLDTAQQVSDNKLADALRKLANCRVYSSK